MKGINFVSNEKDKKIAVQIDLKTIEKYDGYYEDLFDIIIAESRKDDEKITLEEMEKELKKLGKL